MHSDSMIIFSILAALIIGFALGLMSMETKHYNTIAYYGAIVIDDVKYECKKVQ